MFRGFNLKYPEYEVITTQTHLSFTLRSLSVQEEENMKGSLMTPLKLTDHLNRCIYESITKKPDHITDFQSFLSGVTTIDRFTLLYGLYHISYEEIRNYEVRCGVCKKEYPITVKASEMFNYNSYPYDDILTREIKVELPVSEGVSAYVKQPTLLDEIDILKKFTGLANANLDILNKTLIISKFEQESTESITPIVYSDRGDIIDAYRSLPSRDRREIGDVYNENFGKYKVELKMRSYCPSCGNEEVIDVDLVENFFRMVYTS